MTRVSVLALVSLSVLAITGCQQSSGHTTQTRDQSPKSVSLTTVRKSPNLRHVEQMGTIAARQRAGIETKVQAQVLRLPVTLGSVVRKGELLVELDTRDLRARLQQAHAVLQQASQDFARFERLYQQGAVTQQDFEGVKMRQSVAEAGLSEAEAMLSYAQIIAPFPGTITEKTINVGDLAVPGRPLLTLEDDAARQLVVGIPETHRNQINAGDTLPVVVAPADTLIPGVVEEISPSADPASRTFTAKLRLPEGANVHPGQLGRLLLLADEEASVTIPPSALVRRGQLELVFVATSENQASLRLVRSGRLYDGAIEILSGLDGGERVVANPQAGLTDGDPIQERP